MASGFLATALAALALSVTGTAIAAPGAAIASPGGCTAASVRAIRQHVTLTGLPPACRGLPPAELRQAAVSAVREVADHFGKARRRHLAVQASARIGYLFRVAGHGAAGGGGTPPAAAGSSSGHLVIPAGAATLAAWLLTVLTGSYLLYGLVRRGHRGRRLTGPGRRLSVIALHAGLALTGLAIWTGFLVSGWTPAAWIATGLLTPVLGLGMSTLMLAIPDAASRPAAQRNPVLVIAVHGACATATILLALLAAIAGR